MKTKFLFFIMLLCIATSVNAQTLGTKKQLTLKMTKVECEDFCYFTLKDVKSGQTYIIYESDMIDEKTEDNGIFAEINEQFWENSNDTKLKGNIYQVVLEYRKTDQYVNINSEERRKSGKKVARWMVNSISKFGK